MLKPLGIKSKNYETKKKQGSVKNSNDMPNPNCGKLYTRGYKR